MQVIKTYEDFNGRRYSQPWVAKLGKDGRIDFSERVGGYTGAYGKGEAGQLYINTPKEGQVYAYGQKDNRGSKGGYEYTKYSNGELKAVKKEELIEALNS